MLKRIGAEESGEFKAIASGTLPSGKPIVINSDGTVSSVVETTDSAGSSSASVTTYSLDIQSAYDSSNNRVVIVFRGANNNPTAAVGTVSGTSVSFGTPVVIDSSVVNSDSSICFDSSNNKVVVTFGHDGSKGVAYVGTVSGTSISFGSEVVFENAATVYTSATFDSTNNKVVIFYRDSGNSNYGTAIVGTVSGTSISFGTAVVFNSGNSTYIHSSFDSSAGKVVAVYKDAGNSNHGTAIVGTVSGTGISFGSEAVFATTNSIYTDITYDTSANKHVIVWQSPNSTTYGNAIVGTVSSTSISFGSAVVFESAASTHLRAIYDPSVNKTLVLFRDEGNSNKGTAIVGTVSGTSISFGSPFICFDFNATSLSGVYDSSTEQVVASCANGDSSENVHSSVISVGGTNLTSENYIGMSRGFASPATSGSKVTFESGAMGSEHIGVVYDPDVGRIILAYQDEDNSFYGQAVVGTVSGTSISFGTPVVFESAKSKDFFAAYDTANDKVVIVFCDEADSDKGKGIVGTVSGTSISFGSADTFNSAQTNVQGLVYDTNAGKVVVVYRDQGNSNRGTAAVGTVSGTSISFGSEALFNGNNGGYNITAVYDSTAQKVVIAFMDQGNSSYGTSVVGTISGTDITFGSAATFNSVTTQDTGIAYDSSNNKTVITYKDGSNSDKGMAVVGTVSGTSISFGTPVEFVSRVTGNHDPVYHSETGKIIINYISYTSSGKGRFITGKVSGTTIGSFSSPVSYYSDSNSVIVPSVVVDGATNNLVFAWKENTGSTGSALVHTVEVRGEVADGGNASMDIIGSVSDNQGSLTTGQQYFVQTDGTIGTTADDPSVLAGTAISATELLVKT